MGGLDADLNRGSFGYKTLLAIKRHDPFSSPPELTPPPVPPGHGAGAVACIPSASILHASECPVMDLAVVQGSEEEAVMSVLPPGPALVEGDCLGSDAHGHFPSDFSARREQLQAGHGIAHTDHEPSCLDAWQVVRHSLQQQLPAGLNVRSGGQGVWLALRKHAPGPALPKPYLSRVSRCLRQGHLVSCVDAEASSPVPEDANNGLGLHSLACGRLPAQAVHAASAKLTSVTLPFLSAKGHMRGPLVDIAVVNASAGEVAPPGYTLLPGNTSQGAYGDSIFLAIRRGMPIGIADQPLAPRLTAQYPGELSAASQGRHRLPPGLPTFVAPYGLHVQGDAADMRILERPARWTASYQRLVSQQQVLLGAPGAAASTPTSRDGGTTPGRQEMAGPVLRRRSIHRPSPTHEGGGHTVGPTGEEAGDAPPEPWQVPELEKPACFGDQDAGLASPVSELHFCELMDDEGRVSFAFCLRQARQLPSNLASRLVQWYALLRGDGALLLSFAARAEQGWELAHSGGDGGGVYSWMDHACAAVGVPPATCPVHIGFVSQLPLRGLLEEALVTLHNVLSSNASPSADAAQSRSDLSLQFASLASTTGQIAPVFGFGVGYPLPIEALAMLFTSDGFLPLAPLLPLALCSGHRVQVPLLPDMPPLRYSIPTVLEPPPSAGSFSLLLQCLAPIDIVNCLALLLLEQRLLFHCHDPSVVAPVIASLKSLLWPFTWAFQTIACVPPHMVMLLESPVTTLLGMATCHVPFSLPSELWVVDLNVGAVSRGCRVVHAIEPGQGSPAQLFFSPSAPMDEVVLSSEAAGPEDVAGVLFAPSRPSGAEEWQNHLRATAHARQAKDAARFPGPGGVSVWGVPGSVFCGTRTKKVAPLALPYGSEGQVADAPAAHLPVSSTASYPGRPALLEIPSSRPEPYSAYASGCSAWDQQHTALRALDVAVASGAGAALPDQPPSWSPSVEAASQCLPLNMVQRVLVADNALLQAMSTAHAVVVAAGSADALTLAGMDSSLGHEGDSFPLCSAAGAVRAAGHALVLETGEPLGTSTYTSIQHAVHSAVAALPVGLRLFAEEAVLAAPHTAPLPPLTPLLPNPALELPLDVQAALRAPARSSMVTPSTRARLRSVLVECLQVVPTKGSSLVAGGSGQIVFRPWYQPRHAMMDLASASPCLHLGSTAAPGCPGSSVWGWGELPPTTRTLHAQGPSGAAREAIRLRRQLLEHCLISVPPHAAVQLIHRIAAVASGRSPCAMNPAFGFSDQGSERVRPSAAPRPPTRPVSVFEGASLTAIAAPQEPGSASASMSARSSARAPGPDVAAAGSSSSESDGGVLQGGAVTRCLSGVPSLAENPYRHICPTSHSSVIRCGGGPAKDACDAVLSELRSARGRGAEAWLSNSLREAVGRFMVGLVGPVHNCLWLDGTSMRQEVASRLHSMRADLDAPPPLSETTEAVACAAVAGLQSAGEAALLDAELAAREVAAKELARLPVHMAGVPVFDLTGMPGTGMLGLVASAVQRHAQGGMVETGEVGLLDVVGFVETVACRAAASASILLPPESQGLGVLAASRAAGFAAELSATQMFHLHTQAVCDVAAMWADSHALRVQEAAAIAVVRSLTTRLPPSSHEVTSAKARRLSLREQRLTATRALFHEGLLEWSAWQTFVNVVQAPVWCADAPGGASSGRSPKLEPSAYGLPREQLHGVLFRGVEEESSAVLKPAQSRRSLQPQLPSRSFKSNLPDRQRRQSARPAAAAITQRMLHKGEAGSDAVSAAHLLQRSLSGRGAALRASSSTAVKAALRKLRGKVSTSGHQAQDSDCEPTGISVVLPDAGARPVLVDGPHSCSALALAEACQQALMVPLCGHAALAASAALSDCEGECYDQSSGGVAPSRIVIRMRKSSKDLFKCLDRMAALCLDANRGLQRQLALLTSRLGGNHAVPGMDIVLRQLDASPTDTVACCAAYVSIHLPPPHESLLDSLSNDSLLLPEHGEGWHRLFRAHKEGLVHRFAYHGSWCLNWSSSFPPLSLEKRDAAALMLHASMGRMKRLLARLPVVTSVDDALAKLQLDSEAVLGFEWEQGGVRSGLRPKSVLAGVCWALSARVLQNAIQAFLDPESPCAWCGVVKKAYTAAGRKQVAMQLLGVATATCAGPGEHVPVLGYLLSLMQGSVEGELPLLLLCLSLSLATPCPVAPDKVHFLLSQLPGQPFKPHGAGEAALRKAVRIVVSGNKSLDAQSLNDVLPVDTPPGVAVGVVLLLALHRGRLQQLRSAAAAELPAGPGLGTTPSTPLQGGEQQALHAPLLRRTSFGRRVQFVVTPGAASAPGGAVGSAGSGAGRGFKQELHTSPPHVEGAADSSTPTHVEDLPPARVLQRSASLVKRQAAASLSEWVASAAAHAAGVDADAPAASETLDLDEHPRLHRSKSLGGLRKHALAGPMPAWGDAGQDQAPPRVITGAASTDSDGGRSSDSRGSAPAAIRMPRTPTSTGPSSAAPPSGSRRRSSLSSPGLSREGLLKASNRLVNSILQAIGQEHGARAAPRPGGGAKVALPAAAKAVGPSVREWASLGERLRRGQPQPQVPFGDKVFVLHRRAPGASGGRSSFMGASAEAESSLGSNRGAGHIRTRTGPHLADVVQAASEASRLRVALVLLSRGGEAGAGSSRGVPLAAAALGSDPEVLALRAASSLLLDVVGVALAGEQGLTVNLVTTPHETLTASGLMACIWVCKLASVPLPPALVGHWLWEVARFSRQRQVHSVGIDTLKSVHAACVGGDAEPSWSELASHPPLVWDA